MRKLIVGALALALGAAFLFWRAEKDGAEVREVRIVNGQMTVVAVESDIFSVFKKRPVLSGVLKKHPPETPPKPIAQPKPSLPPPPCDAEPMIRANSNAAQSGAENIAGGRLLSLPGPAEAKWLSDEAKRAGVSGFCAGPWDGCKRTTCFLHRSRAIVVAPDASIKSILQEIARVLDDNHSPGAPDGQFYRGALADLAARFDANFPGRRMANAILYDLNNPDGGKRKVDAAARESPRAAPLPAPPCNAKPIIRIPPRIEAVALSNPGRTRYLTPAEAMWITHRARRAGVSGFCLMRNVKKICSSWASACFLGRSRTIVLQPDASIKTLLHEIAHAADNDYSPDCPHRHGRSYQSVFVGLADKFDRRFPRREMKRAVINEIRNVNPNYYKCHWSPRQ